MSQYLCRYRPCVLTRPDDLLGKMLGKVHKRGKIGASSLLLRFGQFLFHARRRIATCAVVVLAVLLGLHVVLGRNGLIAYQGKRAQLQDLRQQAVTLQGENVHLQHHVQRLGSDPDAVEHEAREALHYTRPGEVIYTLPVGTQSGR